MYSVARRITPDQLESIAALLYAELLAGGYTQVCEFHYLHNATNGKPYADPLEMSLALVRAAQRVGMGLTLLPTLYMRSGFGAQGLREDQSRFASTPDSVLRLVEGVQAQAGTLANINVGVAVHSLRTAGEAAMQEVAAFARRGGLPVHIHIAEQTQEVQDCIAHTGQRPIEWLLAHLPVNAHRVAGRATVRCSHRDLPQHRSQFGRRVFDYSGYASLKGQWSIGSDSHVTCHWTEELRLLEYSQRLTQRQRNMAAQTGAATARLRLCSRRRWQAASRPLPGRWGRLNWVTGPISWFWIGNPRRYWACLLNTCWMPWCFPASMPASQRFMWAEFSVWLKGGCVPLKRSLSFGPGWRRILCRR